MAVDTPELAALVPALMAAHQDCRWTVVSGHTAGEDLIVELHRAARTATVTVHAGAEVYFTLFAAHESPAFAYRNADRPEVLADRIDLTVRALRGPTRVILERAAGRIVRSTLEVGTDRLVTDYPWRRLRARLTGARITRDTTDYPAE